MYNTAIYYNCVNHSIHNTSGKWKLNRFSPGNSARLPYASEFTYDSPQRRDIPFIFYRADVPQRLLTVFLQFKGALIIWDLIWSEIILKANKCRKRLRLKLWLTSGNRTCKNKVLHVPKVLKFFWRLTSIAFIYKADKITFSKDVISNKS